MAGAVAEHVVNDPDLLARAARRFVGVEIEKQQNREAVALKTIEHLQDDEESVRQGHREPDPDWTNMFEAFAENASSEQLRDLWGRILAGEIRKRGAFSCRTLLFASTADQSVATAFQEVAPYVIDGECIPTIKGFPDRLSPTIMLLDDAGLIQGLNQLNRRINNDAQRDCAILFESRCLIVDRPLDVPAIPLSRIGRELLTITDRREPDEAVQSLADFAAKKGVDVQVADLTVTLTDHLRTGTEIRADNFRPYKPQAPSDGGNAS